MNLVDLQKRAIRGYSDGEAMGDYFDPITGQPTEWHSGDGLEWFVSIELAETFDPDGTEDEHVFTAIKTLENAIHDLQGAINGLNSESRCCRTCAHCNVEDGDCYSGGDISHAASDIDRELTEEECGSWKDQD